MMVVKWLIRLNSPWDLCLDEERYRVDNQLLVSLASIVIGL